jgi:hypothetical protein
VGANDYARSPTGTGRNYFRERFPITARKFFEGYDRNNGIGVGCYETDERFEVELAGGSALITATKWEHLRQ